MNDFIQLTEENLEEEHICCIIRSRSIHPGIQSKKEWLSWQLKHGHVFYKLNQKGCCFIEYAPLEYSWVPVTGENYLYIYCLWVNSPFKKQGYGKQLMEHCISQAKEEGYSGICMLGSKKQKNWLSNQSFAKSFGFQVVDTTCDGYELLAYSLDGRIPSFSKSVTQKIEEKELTIYYSDQCPFIDQKIKQIQSYCDSHLIPYHLIHVTSLEMAKNLPCVFNNFGAFYKQKFITVNLLDEKSIQRIIENES